MRMQQAGLLRGFQTGINTADPTYCLRKIQQEQMNVKTGKHDQNKPLTLKGLSGAFAVLGVGYALSLFVFLLEKSYSRFKKIVIICKQQQRQRKIKPKKVVVVVAVQEKPAAPTAEVRPKVISPSVVNKVNK